MPLHLYGVRGANKVDRNYSIRGRLFGRLERVFFGGTTNWCGPVFEVEAGFNRFATV